MTADSHEVAVASVREAYAALPPGAPVRLAKRTSNLFRFRDAGAQSPTAPLDLSRVRSRAAGRPGQQDRAGRRHDHL